MTTAQGSTTFRILGPLVVTRGTDVVDLGPAKQRALLAILLCRANSVVSTSDLVEALWPNGQPRTALKNLQAYACGLRKAVVDGGRFSLVFKAPGYQVSLAHAALDAAEFDALTRQGRACLRSGDPERAAGLLRTALDLWQGPALAEFSANPVLRHEANRLTARRLEAYEHLIEAQLSLGSVIDILDEIEELAQTHPIRERLRGLQMAALHQVGRQAEAFAVYDEVRQELARELGLSPSPVLLQQYQAMLAGHRPVAGPAAPSRFWLPRAVGDFVGRRQELGELLRILGTPGDATAPAVAVVHGLPGVGKTTLAVYAAHRLRPTYPDGQILVQLRDRGTGRRTPGAVYAELLRRLGADREADAVDEEDRAALLRAVLVDRKVLLVLDDAVDAEAVHPLLPGAGGSAVLVTSRRLLALDSARYVGLDPLSVSEAVELLGRIVGPVRVDADPDAAERVVRAARLLPVAVRLAATMLVARPDVPLRSSSVDGQAEVAVRTVVAELLDDLDADERQMLASLAKRTAEPLGSTANDAASVAERLIRAHLVTDAGVDRTPRYRMAELLAPYARELAEPRRN
jgi:DNA-binding SARP family transcriptional activator